MKHICEKIILSVLVLRMNGLKKITLNGTFIVITLLFPAFFGCSAKEANLKPRIVVLTDIAPGDIEPDDQESLVRLLAYADRFEIEGIIVGSGWNSSNRSLPPEWMDIAILTIDAYEKDLPNLMKRSGQTRFRPINEEAGRQKLGYWPSADYLRSRTMLGSPNQGYKALGDNNNTAGSDFLIKLADVDDERPIWVTVWGGANTLAQAIWRVQKERSAEELKAFLHKFRVYTILDQDVPYQNRHSDYPFSSHQWLRKEFEKDLKFIWDESAIEYFVVKGKEQWAEYEEKIQARGNLGANYPIYKWGVEGDTPSFLYVMPNGLSNPEFPTQVNWGGYFEWMKSQDSTTYCYTNNKKSKVFDTCTKWMDYFSRACFNDFAARMDWAESGKGNRNPVVIVNRDNSLDVITIRTSPGSSVKLNATGTTDPDGDGLTYNWWVLPDAGTYNGEITIDNPGSESCIIKVPADSAGKNFHVICEVTDNGTPNLTSYRRIIVESTK